MTIGKQFLIILSLGGLPAWAKPPGPDDFKSCYADLRNEIRNVSAEDLDFVAALCVEVFPSGRGFYPKIPSWHNLINKSDFIQENLTSQRRLDSLALKTLKAAQRVASLNINRLRHGYFQRLSGNIREHVAELQGYDALPYAPLLDQILAQLGSIQTWDLQSVDDFDLLGPHVRGHSTVSVPILLSDDLDLAFHLVHEAVHLHPSIAQIRNQSADDLTPQDWFEIAVLEEARARVLTEIVRDSLLTGSWTLSNEKDLIDAYKEEIQQFRPPIDRKRAQLWRNVLDLRNEFLKETQEAQLSSFLRQKPPIK